MRPALHSSGDSVADGVGWGAVSAARGLGATGRPECRFGRVVLLAAASWALSCASGSNGPGQGAFEQATPTTVSVEVNNRNFSRVTVWWIGPASRQRLGVVEGHVSRTFTIERFTVTQHVQLEMQLTAGQRCVTPELQTDPGDRLYLEIAPVFTDTPNCRF